MSIREQKNQVYAIDASLKSKDTNAFEVLLKKANLNPAEEVNQTLENYPIFRIMNRLCIGSTKMARLN
jgi:hypothetical protein